MFHVSEVPLYFKRELLEVCRGLALERFWLRHDSRAGFWFSMEEQIQGYLADLNTPHPPQDRRRTIGIGLRKGPRGVRFLVSEVPLYLKRRLSEVLQGHALERICLRLDWRARCWLSREERTPITGLPH